MSMQIRFWGVRGSCPAPGPETALVGGNTSCVEVTVGSSRVILDAGTGLRRLGNELLKHGQGPVDVTVLLSHVHWDHIQGLPFFAPMYVPGSSIHVLGGIGTMPLKQALHRQMSAPNFPVDLQDIGAKLNCIDLRDKQQMVVRDAEITAVRVNHPDGVLAYRIEHRGQTIVYATDTEHYSCVDQRLLNLARNADVLIYDAQYLPEEYKGERGPCRIGWGHSTYEAGVELARAAGVGQLVLFHHDPMRTDDGVVEIEGRAQQLFANTVAAREGMTFTVGARKQSLIPPKDTSMAVAV